MMGDKRVVLHKLRSKTTRVVRKIVQIVKKHKIIFIVTTTFTLTLTLTTFVNSVIDLNRNYLILKKGLVVPQNYLTASNPSSKIIEIMGEPLLIQKSEESTEYIYLRDNLWIKHLIDIDQNPYAISYNSCVKKSIFIPIQAGGTKKDKVTFNKTVLEEIPTKIDPHYEIQPKDINLVYIVGANYVYLSESYSGGNTTNYQKYFWGYTDLCHLNSRATRYLGKYTTNLNYEGSLEKAPIQVKEFRKLAAISFIGQTSVFYNTSDWDKLIKDIGLSKLEPRTLPQHSY